MLGDPGHRVLIAQRDGEPVGYVRVDIQNGIGTVSIAVAPEVRGVGVGARMLASLHTQLVGDCQIRELMAEIHCEHRASLALFGSAGYVPRAEVDLPLQFGDLPAGFTRLSYRPMEDL